MLYGAKGDGVTDDTVAIIRAITEGRADKGPGPTTYSASTKSPAVVYFPPGTYMVSQTLPLIYYTQMVGDQDDMPVIKVAGGANFSPVVDAMGQWYPGVSQDNFYRQLRNVIIDLNGCAQCTGVHWRVAQATAFTNAVVRNGHQGLFIEDGSGGYMGDLRFERLTFGMYIGSQQFTLRNVTMVDIADTAVLINWGWQWTFVGLFVTSAKFAIRYTNAVGSLTVLDSEFTNIAQTVVAGVGMIGPEGTALVIQNTRVSDRPDVLVSDNGHPLYVVLRDNYIVNYVVGKVWDYGFPAGPGTSYAYDLADRVPARPHSLAPDGNFFQSPRPRFDNKLDVTQLGIRNDGSDMTRELNALLRAKAGANVTLWFPHGTYRISDTVYVPAGTRIEGQVWSVFRADGAAFQDSARPGVPMLRVGNPGEVGTAQIADILFTTNGPQTEATLVEWNMQPPVSDPAACGLWDSHFRIGGASDSGFDASVCAKGPGLPNQVRACAGVHLLMHVRATGGVYMQNVWGWTADHDIDLAQQINIFTARGLLIEASKAPVWLYGTAMEHNILYQYNLSGARNVFMGAIQTETPYYQPSPATPFYDTGLTKMASDPDLCSDGPPCRMALGMHMRDSSDIFIYGTGLYSFFQSWDQGCLKGAEASCQKEMLKIVDCERVYLHSLNTYGSEFILTGDAPYSRNAFNHNTFCRTGVVDLHGFSLANATASAW